MEKIATKKKLYLRAIQAKRLKREIKLSNLAKSKAIRKKLKNRKRKESSNTREIFAPKEFCLTTEESRKLLIEFLNKVISHLKTGHEVVISFKKTRKLITCGTLWATTRIECLVREYPGKISCTYPDDNIVEQLFQHIGLLNKLGKPPRKNIDEDSVRFWHYVLGKSTDDVSKFKDLLQSTFLSEETRSGLFDSMSEAVTNIIHHAYKEGQVKEWRMFAQHKDLKLTVAICDQGIGIPGSLRQKPELKEYLASPMHFARRRRDTALIEVAVQSTRTKTRLPHRGKGLKDMLELVKSGTVGGLRIFSKKGAFDYSASMKLETTKDFKTNINGTIIIWEISLEPNND
ncbi:ATP-binding protein [Methylomonas sp. EFPC1]|uniref:ATP-binding protein n=1 Tax=Methylomonas sp. EFPC1 TaxID=2812647 RepID=UPI0019683502|nr:ATP-binding protein [Methylomonas sp. EFPC1]QSB00781.1 ATP-binding protein [Methylomonas sp. EFPC1]